MRFQQYKMTGSQFSLSEPIESLKDADLILYFGGRDDFETLNPYENLKAHYPNALIMGCTTGGEIYNDEIHEHALSWVAIKFDHTIVRVTSEQVNSLDQSYEIGQKLASSLLKPDLSGVFVLSDGISINGSELIGGLKNIISSSIPITGGLAGDDGRFEATLVGANSRPVSGVVAALGFYGDRIQFGYSSVGGWDVFGPQRVVTKSRKNVLYELDGKPALALYKKYLGEEAEALPGSALLFPLSIYPEGHPEKALVRTILGIDEETQSMTFAGNVPEGYVAQLMCGTLEKLVDGASRAAEHVSPGAEDPKDVLSIMISCIGRKILMGQRINDEIEEMNKIWGEKIQGKIGFYSYGEISPALSTGVCELHNQTMTVTTWSEK